MEEVTNLSQSTAIATSGGQKDLIQMQETMHQLAESTHSISSKLGVISEKANSINSIVTTITKVADQTNLLSLNAAIEDGSIVLIVDIDDLVRSLDKIYKILASKDLSKVSQTGIPSFKERLHILVVDDSITVREVERKILENNGYQVEVAVDGIEAWNAIRTNHYDLIVTDIDMPRLNGIELVTQIKNHPSFKSLPVIIVSYKDR